MTDATLAKLLQSLDIAILEHHADGSFHGTGEFPDWWRRLWPEAKAPSEMIGLAERFPFLRGFLVDAARFWTDDGPAGGLRSRPWIETDTDGNARHLVATAVRHEEQHYLLIELARTTGAADWQLLQAGIAREARLGDRMLEHGRMRTEPSLAGHADIHLVAQLNRDVRSPLHGIVGMTELALGTRLLPEQREYLQAVRESADALVRTISNFVDFAHLDEGMMRLEAAPFGLRQLLDDCAAAIESGQLAGSIRVTADVAPEIRDALIGDSARLHQIIETLVRGVHEANGDGELIIRVECDGDSGETRTLRFSVSMHGSEAPVSTRLLDSFAVSRAAGHPLGSVAFELQIAARLVALMGGRPQIGARPGDPVSFTCQLGLQNREIGTSSPGSPVIEARADGEAGEATEQLHVLVVEDNPNNRRLVVLLLEDRGHTVSVANNGLEALEAVKNETFDVILMDCQMPKMDGFEATMAIREWEATHGGHVPIIALTAFAMVGDRERCFEAGMDGYIAKPVQQVRLYQTIENLATPRR